MAVSKRLRFEIFRRDNHTCVYCGRSVPEVKLQPDHVIPETLGGRDEPSNLVTACGECNSGKSATPPDASMVEGVSQSAVRWAGAMQAAADAALADLKGRDARRGEFKDKWDSWKAGGQTMPIPDSWAESVDRFLSAGLPMPILLDCVDRAMSNKKIKTHDLFRYMCGIAWSKVTELQEAARALADGRVEQKKSPIQAGRLDLARELLADHAKEDEREHLIANARAIHLEISDDVPDEDELIVEAAYDLVGTLTWTKYLLDTAVMDLVALLPPEDVACCEEAAKREARGHLGAEEPEPEVLTLGTARWLRYLQFFRALPAAEQQEWTERVAIFQEASTTDVAETDVAAYVWEGKENGTHRLPGMCSRDGEFGGMCPRKASFAVAIETCERCAQQLKREECAGHPMCQRHAEEMVDGFCDPHTNRPVPVRDVTELVAH